MKEPNLVRGNQSAADLRTLATTYKTYYDELVKTGFAPDQAMQLTIAFQNTALGSALAAQQGG